MNLVKQGQTTDVQVGLRMMKDTEFAYGAKQIKLTNCTVVISDRFKNVTWYNNIVNNDSRYLILPFGNEPFPSHRQIHNGRQSQLV